MRQRRLLWQIFPVIVVVLLLSLAASLWYASHALNDFALDRRADDLRDRAWLLSSRSAEVLAEKGAAGVDSLCREVGANTGTRITVIGGDGTVLGDSHEWPDRMENHADREEVRRALAGGTGVSLRLSATMRQRMMYAAVPYRMDGAVAGVVRVAVPLTDIDSELASVRGRFVLGALVILLIAAGLSLVAARRLSRPLEVLRRGVGRFARGDLDRKLPLGSSREIGDLASAMNEMAAQLDDRIRTVSEQRNELAAVLGGMSEGLVAVDEHERVLRLNDTAARLLVCDRDAAAGRVLPEVTRNAALLKFAERALASSDPVEADVDVVRDGREINLQVRGAPLRTADGRRLGAVLVLNDVTRLRRLETMRREFVANVSHELKTPITSIQGALETLAAGGFGDDPTAPDRFLAIARRQTDRLDAIIEDLLSLSRLEREEGEGLELVDRDLAPTLRAAVQNCAAAAEARGVDLRLTVPEGSPAAAHDPRLLEQAVTNLIDNAVRYNDPGTRVEVSVEAHGDGARIQVRDDGRGIPARHLPRICERFYRVDEARGRKEGGTGLGLAIVKHIAQAHGGGLTVESVEGRGSLFTIHLLRRP